MLEDEQSLATRAAWLSFVGGLTHEAIAARLGLSRIKVTRLIARAQEAGLVKVSIAGRVSACLRLEDGLKERFGLAYAVVAPTLREEGLPLRALGVAGGAMLAQAIQDPDVRVVGMGHGRTLAAAVDHLPWIRRADIRFVSLIGSLTTAATNSFEVMYRLADRTGGVGCFLPAPYMCDSVEAKRVFLAQQSLKEVFDLARQADVLVLGVGAVNRDPHLVKTNLITAEDHKELVDAKAVGEILGVFVDETGAPVQSEINERSVAVPLGWLQGKDVRVIAGGPGKARALSAVLRTGLVRGLVTDEATAERLLDLENRATRNAA